MKEKTKNASSEYKALYNMGFISLEEVDEEEAAVYLASNDKSVKALCNKKRGQDKKNEMLEEDVAEYSLPRWKGLCELLDPRICKALEALGFATPTPIQTETLSISLSQPKRDILGCAPTGSGKTLAFLLPILNHILQDKGKGHSTVLEALIIVPTRELALQIEKHLGSLVEFCGGKRAIRSATLVGGLSEAKQQRILSYEPQIIIGTPGRLAETLQASSHLQEQLKGLGFLVLDEADRLTEKGHFQDLNEIFDLLSNHVSRQRRTFLFSATLEQKSPFKLFGKKLRLNDRHPLFANVSASASTQAAANIVAHEKVANKAPKGLSQYRVDCLEGEKLCFLFYILKSLSGRTLVFVNAISLVKDLASTLRLLLPEAEVGTLHAQMPQRQRFKNLERFSTNKDNKSSILVTSDVAARGLDIPSVETVIHYHIPHALDTFVHRSGRTARANAVGQSISLVSPNESALFGRILTQGSISIHVYPVNVSQVDGLRKTTNVAERIVKIESSQTRQKREDSWTKKAAEELGIELDEPPKSKRKVDTEDDGSSRQNSVQKQVSQMKSQLASLLKCHT